MSFNGKIKISMPGLFALMLSTGIFITNSILRKNYLGDTFTSLNLMVYVAFIFLWLKNNYFSHISMYDVCSGFVSFVLFVGLIVCMINNGNIRLTFVFSVGVPLLFAFIRIRNTEWISSIFRIWLIFVRISVCLIVLGAVLDILTGYSVTNFFAGMFDAESIAQMRMEEEGRIISYMGHPLLSAEISLIYLVSEIIDSRYFNTAKNLLLPSILSVVAAALCGSKTVILLLLFLIFAANINNKRIRNIVFIAIVFCILYFLGVFDVIIGRFITSMKTGDFTTGRNVRFMQLYSSGRLSFNWFSGHSGSMSERFQVALEYPPLRFAYVYGIFYSLILCFALFVYPVLVIFKRRQYMLLLCMLALIADVCTYSGLTTNADNMLIYCSVLFLILNVSYCYKINKEL